MPFLFFFAAATAQLPSLSPDQLRDEVLAADAALFELVFERCDGRALRAMVTDDLEFYHDKAGVVARSGDAFAADAARNCAGWQEPGAWRSRRELVAQSARVEPIPGYGAIEEGDHRFYERKGDGPEKLAGTARFVQLWRRDADGWRLARVFSYAHKPAD